MQNLSPDRTLPTGESTIDVNYATTIVVENPVESASQHLISPPATISGPISATEAMLLREVEKLRASLAVVAKETTDLRTASSATNFSLPTDSSTATAFGSIR